MNKSLILIFFLMLTLVLSPVYGQSNKKMKSYLTKEWISAAKTYETKDTIKYLNDRLNLEKNNKMFWSTNGMDLTGAWNYLEDSKQLQLTIKIDDRSETILLDIDKSSDQVLSLIQKRGDKFMTIIFVEKGSELTIESIKWHL